MGRRTTPERELAIAQLLYAEARHNLGYWLTQKRLKPIGRSARAVGTEFIRLKPDPADLPRYPRLQSPRSEWHAYNQALEAAKREIRLRWLLRHMLTPSVPEAVLSREDMLSLRRRLLAKVRDQERRAADADGTVRVSPETEVLIDEIAERLGHPSRSAALREVVVWFHRRLARRR